MSVDRRRTRLRNGLRSAALAVAVLGAGSLLLARQSATAGFALRGATVYTAPDSAPIHDGVVIVRDGKIAAVGARSAVALPAGVPVRDLTGLTLVAGFWNSHVHFSGRQWTGLGTTTDAELSQALRAMLTRWGFTTVFDTGSRLPNTLALRQRVEAGGVAGPRIFTTGDILYPPGAERSAYRVRTPEEAAAAAQDLIDHGADAVKVYAQTFWDPKLKLSPEVLAAIVVQAHRGHLQVFAHPSNHDGLYNAVDAGVDVLMHTTPQVGPWGPALVAKMKAGKHRARPDAETVAIRADERQGAGIGHREVPGARGRAAA